MRGVLISPLGDIFRDRDRTESERFLATTLLADYAADRSDILADLLMDADEKQFHRLFPKLQACGIRGLEPLLAELKRQPQPAWDAPESEPEWAEIDTAKHEERERLAKRQVNAAVALLRLKQAQHVWPLLKHRPDARVQSYLLARVAPLRADSLAFWEQFQRESDVSARRAMLLCLGEFGEAGKQPPELEDLTQRLFEVYRQDVDPGIHGAAAWVLRRWGHRERLRAIDQELSQRDEACRGHRPPQEIHRHLGERRWYVNGERQTMVVIPGPSQFWMGSPSTEANREAGPKGKMEIRHSRQICRTFAIAAHEVTVEQLLHLPPKGLVLNDRFTPQSEKAQDHPIHTVSWFQAAEYCNRLSEQEGIPQDQWCYEPVVIGGQKTYGVGMSVKKNYLSLRGYRLPTEAEWERACRAGALTARPYGETEELLERYAWYTKNSGDRVTLQVGSLRPNDEGLFDMLGNVYEWCQNFPSPYSGNGPDQDHADIEDDKVKSDIKDSLRSLRGGAFASYPAGVVRSAFRYRASPSYRNPSAGFRLARTFP